MTGFLWGRVRVLQKLWEEYCKQNAASQADRWLHAQLKLHKKIGSQDRRWIRQYFFSIWRFAPLNFVLAEAWQTKAGLDQIGKIYARYVAGSDLMAALRALDFMDLLAFTLLRAGDEDSVQALTVSNELIQYWEGFASAMQTSMQDKVWLSLWNGIPFDKLNAVVKRAEQSFPDDVFQKWLALQSVRPPIWLRLSKRAKFEVVERDLRSIAGLELIEQKERSLALLTERQVTELPSYQRGDFEIQDFASQRIAAFVQAQDGQVVWDACAGGGGKVLAIADATEGKAQFYASDIRGWKLEDLKNRAKRAGVSNLKTFVWDAKRIPEFGNPCLQQHGCDWVIVDAPCSASGTWRRSPDAKFRFPEKELDELHALQLKILSQAAQAVCKGGHLIYATCSVFVSENEAIVDAFLNSELGALFRKVEQKLLGSPEVDSDTMFACLMTRSNLPILI